MVPFPRGLSQHLVRFFEELKPEYHPFLKQEKSYISSFDERMLGKTCLRCLKQEGRGILALYRHGFANRQLPSYLHFPTGRTESPTTMQSRHCEKALRTPGLFRDVETVSGPPSCPPVFECANVARHSGCLNCRISNCHQVIK